MHRLSLVVITFNEEQNIADCIRSADGLYDEVIILDSGSADRTAEIARSLNARVFEHPFDGHIQQKNRILTYATGDYILSLDADERLSPELKESIRLVLNSSDKEGYTMNRLNHLGKRAIKTCGWYPDTKLRLWKNGAGQWGGINPHDRFQLYRGKPGHLNGDILHFTYVDEKAMRAQADKFARIAALELQTRSIPLLFLKLLFSPVFKFIRNFIFKSGFLDGKTGWDICISQSREVFNKYRFAIYNKFRNGSVKMNE